MREGIEALEQELEQEQGRPRGNADAISSPTPHDQVAQLRSQFDDLTSQFRGFPASTIKTTTTTPNDPSLSADFARAASTNFRNPSALKRPVQSPNASKSVRFTDNPQANEQANQAALFPYRDDPDEGPPDQNQLNNQQIHEYHKSVLQDQDDQLDRLGASIGRQRDLSIQIGNELDDQVQMLDDVEEHVDRHQSTLDRAKKSLGDVARKSRDNKLLTIILILIIVLVLLIIILK